jgi:hypothetical protein
MRPAIAVEREELRFLLAVAGIALAANADKIQGSGVLFARQGKFPTGIAAGIAAAEVSAGMLKIVVEAYA